MTCSLSPNRRCATADDAAPAPNHLISQDPRHANGVGSLLAANVQPRRADRSPFDRRNRDDPAGWAAGPDGRARLVGLDVRGFIEHPDPQGGPEPLRRPVVAGGPWPPPELSQAVWRGIPVGTVREKTRRDLAEQAGMWADALAGRDDVADLAASLLAQRQALTAKGAPRRRTPAASRELLKEVALAYLRADKDGSPTPAKDVEAHLRQVGVPVNPGRSGRNQVRKWIQRARGQGLLPPVTERSTR